MANNITPQKQVELSGGAVLPAIIGIIYGIAYYFEYPALSRNVPGILVLGGLASLLILQKEIWVFVAPSGRSWGRTLAALATFVPYFYSLFLMGYLGLWGTWQDIAAYHGIGPVLAALFWTLLGWRMLYVLGVITRKEANRSL